MRLTGIEIRNFRSIGAEPVILNPWKQCNILNDGVVTDLRKRLEEVDAKIRAWNV
jgi:hypothetical protein